MKLKKDLLVYKQFNNKNEKINKAIRLIITIIIWIIEIATNYK